MKVLDRKAPAVHAFVCLVLLALATAGCSFPQPIHTYEGVFNYERMQGDYEPLVSLVYAPRPVAFDGYRGVVIGPVTVGEGWIEDRQKALHYATYYRICLQNKLSALQQFDFVEFEQPAFSDLPEDQILLVESKITKFDMGSGFLRYLSGFLFFQLGATDLQLEGRIVRADSDRTLVEFADRRRAHCNSMLGPNPKNFKSGYAMNVTAYRTAESFAKFVGLLVEDGLGSGAAGQEHDTELAAKEFE